MRMTCLFVGMGEPLQNLEAVLAALPIICHPLGLHFGTPRVTTPPPPTPPSLSQPSHCLPHGILPRYRPSSLYPSQILRMCMQPLSKTLGSGRVNGMVEGVSASAFKFNFQSHGRHWRWSKIPHTKLVVKCIPFNHMYL